MIDEKKLIEDIRKCDRYVVEFGEEKTPFDMVLLDDVKSAINRQPKEDWIPCEERLPSENGWYLVTNELGVVQEQYWGASHWQKLRDECVIAWQPLPQPYKKEGAENGEP